MIEITRENVKSKLWRLENLYKIKPKAGGLINFKLNPIQRRIFDTITKQNPVRFFGLKARQQGMSTFFLLFWLDQTIFWAGQNTGILAHKNENLKYLMEIIRLAHSEMPDMFRPELGDDSKTSLSFPRNNSKIFTSLEIRSTALQNLHISEWCFVKDTRIQSTLGAINQQTTHISGETTGNGIGNDGYELYMDSTYGKNDRNFVTSFSPWFFQPEYRIPLNGMEVKRNNDENKMADYVKRTYGIVIDDEQILFRRRAKKDLKGLFPQEYPETDEDAFMMTGAKFFDQKKIKVLMREARDWAAENTPYKETEDEIYWEKPKTRCNYVMGVDTSEGANDYSCIKVLNVTERCEAYRFRARVGVDYLYKKCDAVGRKFMNALLAVERNNHGHAVILGLQKDCKYPNLYQEERKQKLVGNRVEKFKFGWDTTGITKPIMYDQLKYALEGDSQEDEEHFLSLLTFYDQILLDECLTIEESGGKINAVAGKHDDDCVATAIALQMYIRQRKYVLTSDSPTGDEIYAGNKREIQF